MKEEEGIVWWGFECLRDKGHDENGGMLCGGEQNLQGGMERGRVWRRRSGKKIGFILWRVGEVGSWGTKFLRSAQVCVGWRSSDLPMDG